VKVHYPDLEDDLLGQCMLRFYWIREQPEVRKKPSTSELIDWIGALRRAGIPAERIKEEFPFLGVLLKKEADLEAIQKKVR
jgi:hypothetical protein